MNLLFVIQNFDKEKPHWHCIMDEFVYTFVIF